MRSPCVRPVSLMTVLLLAVATMAGAVLPDVSHDAAYTRAREQMADVLASEKFEKVEVAAASFDRAMVLIYTAVERYLDEAIPALGNVDTARTYGVAVLRGLNDARIRWAGEDGYNLAGKRRLLVSNEDDATTLGDVLARVAILIHDGRPDPGADLRRAARKIFESLLPVEGTGQPIVDQYLVQLRMMSKADRKRLLEFALE